MASDSDERFGREESEGDWPQGNRRPRLQHRDDRPQRGGHDRYPSQGYDRGPRGGGSHDRRPYSPHPHARSGGSDYGEHRDRYPSRNHDRDRDRYPSGPGRERGGYRRDDDRQGSGYRRQSPDGWRDRDRDSYRPQRRDSFQGRPSSGGYRSYGRDRGPQQDRRPGGYRPDHRSGGYRPEHRSGGYRPEHRSGGYRPDQRPGGYRSDQRSGGYRPDQRRREEWHDSDRHRGRHFQGRNDHQHERPERHEQQESAVMLCEEIMLRADCSREMSEQLVSGGRMTVDGADAQEDMQISSAAVLRADGLLLRRGLARAAVSKQHFEHAPPGEEGHTSKLHKVMAKTGVATRRESEALIAEGRVAVDGKVAEIGARVGIGATIEIDGERKFVFEMPDVEGASAPVPADENQPEEAAGADAAAAKAELQAPGADVPAAAVAAAQEAADG